MEITINETYLSEIEFILDDLVNDPQGQSAFEKRNSAYVKIGFAHDTNSVRVIDASEEEVMVLLSDVHAKNSEYTREIADILTKNKGLEIEEDMEIVEKFREIYAGLSQFETQIEELYPDVYKKWETQTYFPE